MNIKVVLASRKTVTNNAKDCSEPKAASKYFSGFHTPFDWSILPCPVHLSLDDAKIRLNVHITGGFRKSLELFLTPQQALWKGTHKWLLELLEVSKNYTFDFLNSKASKNLKKQSAYRQKVLI